MIALPAEALTASVSINLGSTLRFLSVRSRDGFQPVSWWQGQGLAYENYVGQGRGEYNAACIPISSDFQGPSTRVVLTMRLYCTDSRNHTFRWGIADHRSDRNFIGTGPAPSSAVLAQGKFTPDVSGQRVHTESFSFRVSGLPDLFWIYLWRASNSYGNIHIYDVSARIYSLSGPTSWKSAAPYIYDEAASAWLPAAAYILIRDEQGVKHWTPAE